MRIHGKEFNDSYIGSWLKGTKNITNGKFGYCFNSLLWYLSTELYGTKGMYNQEANHILLNFLYNDNI